MSASGVHAFDAARCYVDYNRAIHTRYAYVIHDGTVFYGNLRVGCNVCRICPCRKLATVNLTYAIRYRYANLFGFLVFVPNTCCHGKYAVRFGKRNFFLFAGYTKGFNSKRRTSIDIHVDFCYRKCLISRVVIICILPCKLRKDFGYCYLTIAVSIMLRHAVEVGNIYILITAALRLSIDNKVYFSGRCKVVNKFPILCIELFIKL